MDWSNCPHCGDDLTEFMWCKHCGDITLLGEYQDIIDAPDKTYTPAQFAKESMDFAFKRMWP